LGIFLGTFFYSQKEIFALIFITPVLTRKTLNAEVIQQVYGVEVALKQFEGHTIIIPL
jgi:hypothetical protein